MSLDLTPAQIAQLQPLADAEDYTAAFELLKTWTEDATDPDVQLVHSWLLGAPDVNQGVGPFAALIKLYNMRQGELRGWPISEADNQRASDYIASHFINDMVLSNSQIPDILDIFRFEPNGAKILYENYPDDSDTAKQEGASWVGTFLVSPFGFDMTNLLLRAGESNTTMDCIDDLKNVLFAYDAFQEALLSAFSEMDMTWGSSVNALLAGMSVPEVERLYGLVTEVGPNWSDDNITNFMRGRTAAETFELVRNLGKNDTLDHLMSAWLGRRTNLTTDETFVATASEFFQTIAGNVQRTTGLERLDDKSIEELVALAQTDAKYRNALRSLSTFALDLTTEQYEQRHLQLFDPMTGQGDMTLNYLEDRAAALHAFREYDLSDRTDHFYNAFGLPAWMWGDLEIVDRASGEHLTMDGVDLSIADTRYLMFGGDGVDELTGGTKDDRLYGGAGNDNIDGREGDDYVEGNDGEDTLRGHAGQDWLLGGAGDDTLISGGAHEDVVSGGAGDDHLEGGSAMDELIGGSGQDHLHGDGGHDTLLGSGYYDDVNRVFGTSDDGDRDVLEGGEGHDRYLAYAGDVIRDADGNGIVMTCITDQQGLEHWFQLGLFAIHSTADENIFEEHNEFLDITITYTYDETAHTLNVNDWFTIEDFTNGQLCLGLGYDSFIWYYDESYWWNGDFDEPYNYTDDYRVGTDADDIISAGNGNDTINGGEGDDTLRGQGDNDILNGEGGDDRLYGDTGDDWLNGGEGNDSLNGGTGDDTLRGGGGNRNTLSGGQGNDTYLFAEGDGDVRINNRESASSHLLALAERNDVLRLLGGINPEDVQVTRSSDDLNLTLLSSGETVRIDRFFQSFGDNDHQLSAVEFSDGTCWSYEQFLELAQTASEDNDELYGTDMEDSLYALGGDDRLLGGEGDDILHGGDGRDRLDGGGGNDTLRGGQGDGDMLTGGNGHDLYLYALGDGDITISNTTDWGHGRDRLRFLGDIKPDDVTVTRTDDYRMLLTLGNGDVITVLNQFNEFGATDRDDALHRVVFTDGTVWGYEELEALAVTDSSDDFIGTHEVDVLEGAEGNDYFYGLAGNDQLSGGAGRDRLFGDGGEDTLNGGSGDDRLAGGSGNDVLIGGEGGDELSGGAGDDSLRCGGSASMDRLSGGTGNDTYLYGLGDGRAIIDNWDDGGDSYDVLRFLEGIAPDDVAVSRNGDTLELTLTDGGVVYVSNHFNNHNETNHALDAIEFYGGTIWRYDDLQTRFADPAADAYLDGTGQADNLTGGAGDDTLHGQAGNDRLQGGSGADTLYGEAGDDVMQGGEGDDQLAGGNGDDNLDGGDGDDQLSGGAGDDTLRGGSGDRNIVSGDGGSDTYLYGTGDGNLILNNWDSGESRDVLRFLDGITPNDVRVSRQHDHLLLTLSASGEIILVTDYFQNDGENGYVLEAIEFTDETTWGYDQVLNLSVSSSDSDDSLFGSSGADTLDGGGGDDRLHGRAGNDVISGGSGGDTLYGDEGDDTLNGGDGVDSIHGGEGNDRLRGGAGDRDTLSGDAGDDIYLYGSGDGDIVIDNLDRGEDRHDRLRFLDGIEPDEITVSRVENDLLLTMANRDDVVTVLNYFQNDGANDYRLQAIEFAGDVTWSYEQILSMTVTGTPVEDILYGSVSGDALRGLEGDDKIYGRHGDDLIHGGEGADHIYGESGNDILNGDEGNDHLYGGAGNDTLRGGTGNDFLYGNAGDDTYLYGLGDDYVSVSSFIGIEGESNGLARRGDILRFLDGISPDDLIVRRSRSESLTLSLATGEGSVSVHAYFSDAFRPGSGVSAIEFADRTIWNYERIEALSMVATEGDDEICGTNGADSFDGQEGSDFLYGLDGDDEMWGGTGDDELYGGFGSDTLHGGSGDDGLYSAAGDDQLFGNEGDDQLVGDIGDDFMSGGQGSDLYRIDRIREGTGQDRINNYDGDDSSVDTLRFSQVATDELWFSRSGDDLTINLAGSEGQVTIEQWYNDSAYEVERIEAGESVLFNHQVDQLVMAMASFDVPSGVGNIIPQDVMETLQPILAENWQTIA